MVVLEGKNVKLCEANAVAFYLASPELKNEKNLFALSQVVQWMNYSESHILPLVLSWVLPCLSDNCPKISPSARKLVKEDLVICLKGINEILFDKTYFIGERVSVADLYVFSVLMPMYQHVLDAKSRSNYENLSRWFNTILNQPPTLRVVESFEMCKKPLKGSNL